MIKQRSKPLLLIGAVLLAGAVSSQAASSIGASFIGRSGGDVILAPSATAGVVPQGWWNNIDEAVNNHAGRADDLADNNGNFTAVSLAYTAADSWNSDGPTVTANDKMMKGILKATTTTPAILTIAGLPTSGRYDVYVYSTENGTGALGNIAIGSPATTTYYLESQGSFGGTFIQATVTTPNPTTPPPPGAYPVANYALFSNQAPDASGQITLTVTKEGAANDGMGIAGVQIVQVSGPAFPPSTAPCSISTPPANATALPGATPSFVVAASGPAKFQWKKGGVAVPGATASTYTLPAVSAADNGLKVSVDVYNSINTNTSPDAILTVINKAAVSMNFIGRNGGDIVLLGPGETAGVVQSAGWNNVEKDGGFNATESTLFDNKGQLTSVQLSYATSDSWSSDGPTITPNDRMMKGILKFVAAGGTITLDGLPNGSYDLYVYGTENGTGAEGSIGVAGGTTYYMQWQASFGGIFEQCTATDPNGPTAGNYVVFANQNVTTGKITLNVKKTSAANDGVGIAGIQLIQNSGASIVNTNPCSIVVNPVNTLSSEGGRATFTVVTAGPTLYQWYKNGAPINGATGPTLNLTGLAVADSTAQYVVKAYNNINTNFSVPAMVLVEPLTPAVPVAGFLKVERWENIGGNTGLQGIQDLTNAIAARGPDAVFYVGGGDIPQSNPDISNFGGKISGWVKPPVDGDYYFYIRSDDSSQLYINSTSAGVDKTNSLPNIYVDPLQAYENGCCNGFQDPGSAVQTTPGPITLKANNLYGIVLLYKEGGGGDWAQVAMRNAAENTAGSAQTPLAPGTVYTVASAAGHRATLTVQPVSQTVVEDRSAAFTVNVAVQPTTDQFAVQWYTNGVAVTGATGARYQIDKTTLAMNNLAVSAKVMSLVGTLTTSNAVLTVIADTTPPVPSVGTIKNQNGTYKVGIGFDEPVNPATLVAGNFTLTGATGTFLVVTNSHGDYNAATFDNVALTEGQSYSVTVKSVADTHGNAIPAAGMTANFKAYGNFAWANTGTPKRPDNVVPVGTNGFDVINGGRTEWGTYDEATIAYVPKTGDFDVAVRVAYAEPATRWTRVGLHARYDLNIGEDPNDRNLSDGTSQASAYAQTHVNPAQTLMTMGYWDPNDPVQPQTGGNALPNNGHEQNQRVAKGAATSGWGTTGTAPTYPNAWLRLARVGDQIRGYRSTDGVNWTSQGSTVLTDQQPTMFVGMSLGVETGNLGYTGFDVWADPFNPQYDRQFVAQFRDFGTTQSATVSVIVPSILSIAAATPQNVTITYTGLLQSAPSVSGPWTDVQNSGTPQTLPATGASTFFRVRSQ